MGSRGGLQIPRQDFLISYQLAMSMFDIAGHYRTLLDTLSDGKGKPFKVDEYVEKKHGRCTVPLCSRTFNGNIGAERHQKHGVFNVSNS